MKIRRSKADQLFSDYVRARDRWICQRCGKQYPDGSQGLHSAHIFSRRHWATRHDPGNAVALCYGCHQYFSGNPMEFSHWCSERYGPEYMDKLCIRAHATGKKSRSSERLRVIALQAMLDQG